MLQRLTLMKKLVAAFAAIVAAFAVLLATVASMTTRVAGDLDEVASDVDATRVVLEVGVVAGAVDGELSRAVYPDDPQIRASAAAAHGDEVRAASTVLDQLHALELTAGQRQLADTVHREFDGMLTVHAEQLRQVQAGDQAAAVTLDGQAAAAYVAILDAVDVLAREIDAGAQANVARGEANAGRAMLVSILGAVVVAAGALGFGVWLARGVSRQVGANAAQVTGMATDLGAVASQMGANAEETATQADVVAAAGEQVSQNVQTVAAAVEEMSASVREIAENAGQASQVATDAVRTVEDVSTKIGRLGESSTEIGKVVEVITSIAEQTNLLALNATIEAARAGEAGKGFAVVANEVKELAQETARATEEISARITAIQSETGDAVDGIAQINEVIARIADMQNTIASAVEEQTATTNEIGQSMTEAAQGATQIAENITSVAGAASDTSQGAVQTQEAARQLRAVADELQSLVGSAAGGDGTPGGRGPRARGGDGASTTAAVPAGLEAFQPDREPAANGHAAH